MVKVCSDKSWWKKMDTVNLFLLHRQRHPPGVQHESASRWAGQDGASAVDSRALSVRSARVRPTAAQSAGCSHSPENRGRRPGPVGSRCSFHSSSILQNSTRLKGSGELGAQQRRSRQILLRQCESSDHYNSCELMFQSSEKAEHKGDSVDPWIAAEVCECSGVRGAGRQRHQRARQQEHVRPVLQSRRSSEAEHSTGGTRCTSPIFSKISLQKKSRFFQVEFMFGPLTIHTCALNRPEQLCTEPYVSETTGGRLFFFTSTVFTEKKKSGPPKNLNFLISYIW